MRPLLTLSLLLPCLSFAAESTSYGGPADCRFFNDQPKEYERGTWSGACADGYATGNGVLQWYHDDQPAGGYQGGMVRGRAQGHGEYFMNNGGVLAATFEGGGPVGQVDFTYPDGQRYHGIWDGGPNGAGTMFYTTGGSLTGNWHGHHPDGKFTINYPNGKQREADFHAAGDTDSSAAAEPHDKMREPAEGRVSTERNELARGLSVPADKAYDKLTPEQQATLKSRYVILQQDDEPPYPINGPRPFFKFISDAQSQMDITAEISIDVIISKDGKATGVRILKSPLPDLSRFVAGELLKQKYKPAKCAGEPCEMVYPVRFKLVQS